MNLTKGQNRSAEEKRVWRLSCYLMLDMESAFSFQQVSTLISSSTCLRNLRAQILLVDLTIFYDVTIYLAVGSYRLR